MNVISPCCVLLLHPKPAVSFIHFIFIVFFYIWFVLTRQTLRVYENDATKKSRPVFILTQLNPDSFFPGVNAEFSFFC